MQLKLLEQTLNKFGRYVVKQARTNLTKKKRNVSKNLYNSISYEPFNDEGEIGVRFKMADYGKFIDQGVKGAGPNELPKGAKNYGKQQAPKSPFAFGRGGSSKGGGIRKGIDQWVVRKKVFKGKVRDKQGRFIKRKSLVYMISRSIYLSGIKPSMFFTKPFNKAYENLPPEIQKAFVTDFEKIIID